MNVYQQTAQKRSRAHQQAVTVRHSRAWEIAHQAASLLKEEFGATQVVVFGSLLQTNLFHIRSDIDLAVWNLKESVYYRAVSRLLSLEPDIPIDLIEVEHASTRLREKIEREGQLL